MAELATVNRPVASSNLATPVGSEHGACFGVKD